MYMQHHICIYLWQLYTAEPQATGCSSADAAWPSGHIYAVELKSLNMSLHMHQHVYVYIAAVQSHASSRLTIILTLYEAETQLHRDAGFYCFAMTPLLPARHTCALRRGRLWMPLVCSCQAAVYIYMCVCVCTDIHI